ATKVAEIAAACEIGERTFFSYFASKEDVALSDISDELDRLAALIACRRPGQAVLELLRVAGQQRVELFRSHALQVRQRREVEAANPRVHARAVALRERRERALLAPEFARELGTAPTDSRVVLLTAAFTGISSVLDTVIADAADDEAARRTLDRALDLLDAALDALR
ncbi:MAG: TetR family transcriptional regulator, partial [Pseudonocardia sp.]|nr:TetR family transcriptional regulator [Pseudonocardia sp.]